MPGITLGMVTFGGGGGGGGASASLTEITSASSPYDASAGDILAVDSTGGAVVINLPASGSDATVHIVDTSGTAFTNNITINAETGDTILGRNTLTISNNYASVTLGIDAESTDWKIISFNIP